MQEYEEKLKSFLNELGHKSERMIGYPANFDYDYSFLYDFFKYSINNIGDPLSDGPYKVKAHSFEKEVIEYFADVTGIENNNFWGYVTNGGTEGNMYGLYVAREMYPDSIVYYSREAHYSIPKILKLLKMPSISINTDESGSMCLDDLKTSLAINRTKTPIIMATIGTTMKGAIDPLGDIKKMLNEFAFLDYYLHCDAALSGGLLPFVDGAPEFGLASGVHSLSISGHKMFGCPMPCGIVLARKDYVDRIGRSIEYIGAIDTTLSGSRNGHSTLLLWYSIQKHGLEGHKKMAKQCLENAKFLVKQLVDKNIEAWANDYSITVLIPKPSQVLIDRWQLATQGDLAHIITMPHVTKELLEIFVKELKEDLKSRN